MAGITSFGMYVPLWGLPLDLITYDTRSQTQEKTP